MSLKAVLIAGLTALLSVPASAGGYGITDPTKPFNLYAAIGGLVTSGEYAPYQLNLVKSGDTIVLRAYDYNTNETIPAPSQFTLADTPNGAFVLNGQFRRKAVRARQASVPEVLEFASNPDYDGFYRFVAEYEPPGLGKSYIDAQLLSRSAGDEFDFPQGGLCTAKNGGYLVYTYGLNPQNDPDGLARRPCYGATLQAFPLGVRRPGQAHS